MEELTTQLRRLKLFIRWATLSTFLFAAAYLVLFFILRDWLAGIAGGVGIGMGLVLLLAWQQAQHAHLNRAIMMVSGGQLLAALTLVLAFPALYPVLILVPLLTVTLALLYLADHRVLRRLVLLAGFVAMLVGVCGVYVALVPLPAPGYTGALIVLMIASMVGLILLTLWQFNSRLQETLAQVYSTNTALAATNTNVEHANTMLNQRLEEQHRLLELVTTLETPTVSLADHVLLAPIVGHLDNRRAQDLTDRLLQAVGQQQTRLVIIDIAGVTLIDTMVAQSLLQAAQALRLLGCRAAISGISAGVATTLVQLGIHLEEILTARSPQEALAQYALDEKRTNDTSWN